MVVWGIHPIKPMNNEVIRNHYDAFTRIEAFGGKHGGKFAAGSRAVALFTEMGTVTAAMEQHGVKKLSGSATYHGGTDAKSVARELVREDLRAIRDTAEAIADAEGLPEFDDLFLLPRSGSTAMLLAKARAFLKDATPHKALFIEFELPADFLEDLQADIALLEKAGDDQDSGMSEQVGGTAELSAQTTRGIVIRKQLLPIVRNKFRNDPGILAEWESAVHVVRPQRQSKTETAAPVA